ncbi:MAG: hypothetical protein ACLTYN_14470 [Dysosmobacter welbionis]
MNKQDEILPVSPEQTYHAIRGSIVTAQHSVAKAVNSAMVTAYWEIGSRSTKRVEKMTGRSTESGS